MNGSDRVEENATPGILSRRLLCATLSAKSTSRACEFPDDSIFFTTLWLFLLRTRSDCKGPGYFHLPLF